MRGTFKQIANAAFKCKAVKVELIKLVLIELVKEMIGLCSKYKPSRCSASPSTLVNLALEDVCYEWSNRAPTFYAFLTSAAMPSKRKNAETSMCLASIAVAGSVLLRERCKEMNAVQNLISMIIMFSSYQIQ